SKVPLSFLFSKAKTRINLIAIDAGIATKANHRAFYDALARGVIMTILVLDEESKSLLHEVEKAWPIGGNAYETLQESLKRLCLLKEQLPKAKLEIRFVDLLPVHSMIVIDPESESATMQVTLHQYNSH